MTNTHAFILGALASWAPSAVLFACLVYFRGTREVTPERTDAVDAPKHNDRDCGHEQDSKAARRRGNVSVFPGAKRRAVGLSRTDRERDTEFSRSKH
jgi:hypothetical protein